MSATRSPHPPAESSWPFVSVTSLLLCVLCDSLFYGAPQTKRAARNPEPRVCTSYHQLPTSNSPHLPPEVSSILSLIVGPLLRQIVRRVDRRNRAHRNACTAIDALHRVDKQLVRIREPSLILLWVDT